MIVKSKEGEQGGGKKDQKKKTVKIAERAEEPQVASHIHPCWSVDREGVGTLIKNYSFRSFDKHSLLSAVYISVNTPSARR